MDVTPSPSKLLTEHPLGAFIKTEDEEEVTSCDCAVVKQEVKSEAPDSPQEEEEEARGQEEVQADSAPVEDEA